MLACIRHSPYVDSCPEKCFFVSASLRTSGLAASALARLGPHVFHGSVQDPGPLTMKSISCGMTNDGEEAMDILSFR